jgi:hypothetical protein
MGEVVRAGAPASVRGWARLQPTGWRAENAVCQRAMIRFPMRRRAGLPMTVRDAPNPSKGFQRESDNALPCALFTEAP